MEDLTSYLETHFEVVSQIVLWEEISAEGNLIKIARQKKGQGGVYELAKEWTDEFETKYKDIIWGEDLDYFDTIEEFLNEKNNPKNKYPFNEGDDYWTIEDNKLIISCWDNISEELYDENPNQVYYKTEKDAILMILKSGSKKTGNSD